MLRPLKLGTFFVRNISYTLIYEGAHHRKSVLLVPSLGFAGSSDWMNAQLGLAPLKYDPSGQI